MSKLHPADAGTAFLAETKVMHMSATNETLPPNALQAVDRALARIEARDAEIHAWTQLDAAGAREQAKRSDDTAPLSGLTLGVKDIVQVKGLRCEYGSEIDRGNVAVKDAAIVADLKALGAIVIGKTTTPEYAFLNPTPTRNPHDTSRSPGGSSSGSAAAVADGQVDIAIGTQTAGSILRPASFCGVVGYKPTHNRISLAGVKCVSPTLDTLGWITRDVGTSARVKREVIGGAQSPSSVRIGFCRTVHWEKAERGMQSEIEEFARRIGAKEVHSAPAELDAIHASIMRYEMRRELSTERLQFPALMSPILKDYLESTIVPLQEYEQALQSLVNFDAETLFGDFEILITPAAPGEAVRFGSTGDPSFNRFATLLGLPAISIPLARGPNNLPLGLQLLARRNDDDLLLSTAAALETIAAFGSLR